MRDPQPVPNAAKQREAVLAVVASLEHELVDLSDNPSAFSQVQNRRAQLLREASRLEFLEKREQVEGERQHREALVERLADVRRRATAQQTEAAKVNSEMLASIDGIVILARRARSIGVEVEKLARQEDIALTVLHKAGVKVAEPRPGISATGLDKGSCLRLHASATAILRAAGIAANSPVALAAVQNLSKI